MEELSSHTEQPLIPLPMVTIGTGMGAHECWHLSRQILGAHQPRRAVRGIYLSGGGPFSRTHLRKDQDLGVVSLELRHVGRWLESLTLVFRESHTERTVSTSSA